MSAQTAPPAFAVVSVKENKSPTNMSMLRNLPSGFSASNALMGVVVAQAYGVTMDQLFGLPDWTNSERYDIDAKVEDSDLEVLKKLTPKERGLMLQSILRERFQLVAHLEKRDLPIFNLVVAKSGLKMKEADPANTYSKGILGFEGKTGAGNMIFNSHEITGQAIPIQYLITCLWQITHRTVVDQTALKGKYDVNLKWGSESGTEDATAEDHGPSIFTALQEQLGLKLEPAKGPVEVLVVNHIEKPIPN